MFQAILDFLQNVLAYFYELTGNYGVAIIILTVLVKLITLPLTQKQLTSTKKMQELQPLQKKLQEKYKNDKEKLNQAMMELWKEHKINPVAGCLPLLIQMPFLIAIFNVLRNSDRMFEIVEDFSPLFLGVDMTVLVSELAIPIAVIAVVLSGGTTFLQQWMMMNDKNQKAMLIVMPVMLGYFSYNFPAGLVLYWVLNNVFSMIHHLFIGKAPEKGATQKE